MLTTIISKGFDLSIGTEIKLLKCWNVLSFGAVLLVTDFWVIWKLLQVFCQVILKKQNMVHWIFSFSFNSFICCVIMLKFLLVIVWPHSLFCSSIMFSFCVFWFLLLFRCWRYERRRGLLQHQRPWWGFLLRGVQQQPAQRHQGGCRR